MPESHAIAALLISGVGTVMVVETHQIPVAKIGGIATACATASGAVIDIARMYFASKKV